MGYLTYAYKKSVYLDIINGINNGYSKYFAFAAGPVPAIGNSNPLLQNSYNYNFLNDNQMIFGVSLSNTNFCPVISNNPWIYNTVYNRYDSNTQNLTNFYIVTPPSITGGDYLVYKCIDNANNGPSTVAPSIIQSNTFITSDNYSWRYMYSISDINYKAYSTDQFVPVIANTVISNTAANNSGIDVVSVVNSGQGYNSYHDSTVQSVNNNIIQIGANASAINSFYNNNAIYIYSIGSKATSQLFTIVNYISNSTGNWVYANGYPDTTNIVQGQTSYKISPAVIFQTDGLVDPLAYSVIDPTVNSIAKVVMLNTGSNISRATVSIQSNTNFGFGANLYALCPPPGGHGSSPENELGMQGFCVNITFANSAGGVIPTNIQYNKIGIAKNLYNLNVDGSKSNTLFSNNAFNQLLTANVTSSFNIGDTLVGVTSGSAGLVAFANTSTVYLTGDKTFINNETVISSNSSANSILRINTIGQVFAKDVYPLYIKNINNVSRSNTQSESFKAIIQI